MNKVKNRGRKPKQTIQSKISSYTKKNGEYCYLYNIIINQHAVIENGWELDLVDIAIFNAIFHFINSGKSKKTECPETGSWYWIDESKILNDLPLLPISGSNAIYKRISNLITFKLIERKKDNSFTGLKLLRLGENANKLFYKSQNSPSENS